MNKLNCWEIKNCGRQPGGFNLEKLGVCPAATINSAHGINNGINGGRACWTIKGTFCDSQIQGGFAEKLSKCLQCSVYDQVREEEAGNFVISKEILKIINGQQHTL